MIQHRQQIFFHSKTSRLVLGPTELVSGPSCHAVNRLGQEAEHSTPSSTTFSEFHYTSTIPHALAVFRGTTVCVPLPTSELELQKQLCHDTELLDTTVNTPIELTSPALPDFGTCPELFAALFVHDAVCVPPPSESSSHSSSQ